MSNHLRGCLPTPRRVLRHLTRKTRKLLTLPPPPETFDATGQVRDWDMDGNDAWGDCVFAGEANYKRAVTKGTGVSEIQISANACIHDYLTFTHGLDEGADISTFLDWMERVGLEDDHHRYHKNGRHGALDETSPHELRFGVSLFRGVKAAVAADVLDSVVAGKSGWVCRDIGTGPIDHNVEILGYGTVNECLTMCGTKSALPDSIGLLSAFVLYTWETVGVITTPSLRSIIGEAHVRITDPARGDAMLWDPQAASDFAEVVG
jgi:hypothetical protein